METKKEYQGLKKSRIKPSSKPVHHCSNCKCSRYSPCGCEKGKAK